MHLGLSVRVFLGIYSSPAQSEDSVASFFHLFADNLNNNKTIIWQLWPATDNQYQFHRLYKLWHQQQLVFNLV